MYKLLEDSAIKNAKFSECCFYMNTNILGDFQIDISVHLTDCSFLRILSIVVDKTSQDMYLLLLQLLVVLYSIN